MGGRGAPGRLAYLLAVAVVLVGCGYGLWTSKRPIRFRITGAEALLAAAGLWLVLQWTPLPASWASALSPLIANRLPMWSADANPRLGLWNRLTVSPHDTEVCLWLFAGHAALFLAVLQRLENHTDIRRVVGWLAAAPVFAAVIGLAQYFTGAERFLWVWEHPFRSPSDAVKGYFENANHLAHLLALGVGPLSYWLFLPVQTGSSSDAWRPWAAGAGLAVAAIAGLLSYSRGGWAALGIAAAVSFAPHVFRAGMQWRALAAAAAVALVLMVALSTPWGERARSRWNAAEAASGFHELSARRNALWTAHAHTLREVWMCGAGAGSHRTLYPTFMNNPFGVDFSHAENGYLQVWLELGVVGLALLLGAWWSIGHWLRKAWLAQDAAVRELAPSIGAGLLASALHSLGDFVWYIPTLTAVTVVLAACACRLAQLTEVRGARSEGPSAIVTTGWAAVFAAAIAACLGWCIHRAVGPALADAHWRSYFRLSRTKRHDAELDEATLDTMAARLRATLTRNPYDGRAHQRLADVLFRKFELEQTRSENPMPLAQIREAAVASQFPDRDAVRSWLDVAVGDHLDLLFQARRHARQAVACSPLRGEAYVQLADVLFLDNLGEHAPVLVNQALKTRPHSGRVLLKAGGLLVFQGQENQAMDLWRQAFAVDAMVRRELILRLTPAVDAATMLREFRPDLDALDTLFWRYEELDRTDDARVVGEAFAEALTGEAQRQPGRLSAESLLRLANLRRRMKQPKLAAEAAESAVAKDPGSPAARRVLWRSLADCQRWSEAEPHARWLLRRRPDDPTLRSEYRELRRRASAQPDRTIR